MREFNPRAVPRPEILKIPPWIKQGQPLDIEIGAGQGLHAINRAKCFPERYLIAIERTHTRFAKLQSRYRSHGEPPNLWPVQADAMHFMAHFVPDDAIENVFLLYPNPYPKAKQANLRWHRSPFFGFLIQKLRPYGRIHLATNQVHYAQEAEHWIQNIFELQMVKSALIDSSMNGRTHFERKYLSRGETCFDLIFEKSVQ